MMNPQPSGGRLDVKDDGRISVAKVLACVEEMDYIVDGPLLDLVKSVVPGAVEVDRLSLNDAVQVSAAIRGPSEVKTVVQKRERERRIAHTQRASGRCV